MKIQNIYSLDEKNNIELVYIVTKSEDILFLEKYINDKKIIKNITDNFEKKENILKSYFLGEKNIAELHVIILKNTANLHIAYKLGELARKLPKSFVSLINPEQDYKNIMQTLALSLYSYDEYKTKKTKQELFFITLDDNQKQIYQKTKFLIKNIILARDLGNKPSNEIYPESFIDFAKNLKFKNTKIRVLDYDDIKKEGLNLLEAVGRGSQHKPRLLILEKTEKKNKKTLAFIGKGVTFDTGGIQVKPGDFMYEMKGDMCGGASVLACAHYLDEEKLDINIIYAIPLAESHISKNAFKPSDIIKSYSGKTVDIIHTDAEGRLILADALSYVIKNYKIDHAMTIATLTGACLHALGLRYAAVMGDDEKIIQKFLSYSEENFEKYCRLPFDNYFIEKTKSDIADLQNLSKKEYAGTIMAGAFLANFVEGKTKFTHLDIAGTAMNSGEPYGYANSGMTGFGVESISQIIKSYIL